MTEKRNSALAGLAFGILSCLFIAIYFEIQHALIAGLISGIAFGLAIYYFLTSNEVKEQTQIELLDGEVVIRSGGANHFKNIEAV